MIYEMNKNSFVQRVRFLSLDSRCSPIFFCKRCMGGRTEDLMGPHCSNPGPTLQEQLAALREVEENNKVRQTKGSFVQSSAKRWVPGLVNFVLLLLTTSA